MKLLVLDVADAYSILFKILKFNNQHNPAEGRPRIIPVTAGGPVQSAIGSGSEKKADPFGRFLVDQDGAEITSRSGRVKVKIGRNALDGPAFFEIVEDNDPAFANAFDFGRSFEIKVEGVNGKPVQNDLRYPIQIEYHFDPGEFLGREGGIRLFYYAEKLNVWLILPGHADAQSRRVIGQSSYL